MNIGFGRTRTNVYDPIEEERLRQLKEASRLREEGLEALDITRGDISERNRLIEAQSKISPIMSEIDLSKMLKNELTGIKKFSDSKRTVQQSIENRDLPSFPHSKLPQTDGSQQESPSLNMRQIDRSIYDMPLKSADLIRSTPEEIIENRGLTSKYSQLPEVEAYRGDQKRDILYNEIQNVLEQNNIAPDNKLLADLAVAMARIGDTKNAYSAIEGIPELDYRRSLADKWNTEKQYKEKSLSSLDKRRDQLHEEAVMRMKLSEQGKFEKHPAVLNFMNARHYMGALETSFNDNSPAADETMVKAYEKMVQDGAVLQGESDTYKNAGTLMDRIIRGGFYDAIEKRMRQRLPAEIRKDLYRLGKRMYQLRESGYEDFRSRKLQTAEELYNWNKANLIYQDVGRTKAKGVSKDSEPVPEKYTHEGRMKQYRDEDKDPLGLGL